MTHDVPSFISESKVDFAGDLEKYADVVNSAWMRNPTTSNANLGAAQEITINGC